MPVFKEKDTIFYNLLCSNLENNIPFTFSRWGDGEWNNINNKLGTNCDGNVYYPDLGLALKNIVSIKQPYIMGIQNISREYSPNILSLQDWVNADILHYASIDGILNTFISKLEKLNIIYIGNKDLKKLHFINDFIEIPSNNVWTIRDQVEDKIKYYITGSNKVFLFSAGMAANVFIHDMYQYNKNNTYIDVGSVFDPYVGKKTRTYHRNLVIK